MATDFENSISSFQEKIDAKRLLLETKATAIKASLLDEKAAYDKRASLVRAATGLNTSSYLDDITTKDFPTLYNSASGRLDGDTIRVTSPYEVGYGSNYGGTPKTTPLRLDGNIDTYEIAKLDSAGNILPYNQKKLKYHVAHYAKANSIPESYVTQKMLNDEAEVQTNRLTEELYKGQTWDEYGVKPKIGDAVPYPKEVQNQLQSLYTEFYKLSDTQAENKRFQDLSDNSRLNEFPWNKF